MVEKGGCPKSLLCSLSGDASFQVPAEYAGHPGGQPLLDVARRTKCPHLLFLSYHMGSDLNGKVAASARAMGCPMPQRGEMYDEMQEVVYSVKKNHPEQRTYFQAYCLFLTLLLPSLFFWWLYKPSLLLGISVATVFELYFVNIFHTRHHRGSHSFYNNWFLQAMTSGMYTFIDSTWGYYPEAWLMNHNVKHHVYTNDTHTDTDVPSMYPFVRSCKDTPRLWFHRFQTFYWPFLMPFAAVNFPLNNILVHGGSVVHFAMWIVLMFILPAWLHGPNALVQSMILQAWAGGSIAYKFAVSHAHNDLTSSTTSEETFSDVDDWLKSQVQESISYGGYWFTFLYGGLNMQIEHHICPVLDPPLYALVAPQLAQICKKHGVQYTHEPSFLHAICSFHRKLWTLGWND